MTNPKYIEDLQKFTRIVTKELDMAIYPQYIGQEEWCVNKLLKQRKFKFNTDLNGIVIGYEDWEFLSETGRIIDDTPVIFWRIRCKFRIFHVEKDSIIRGITNSIGYKYVGSSFFGCIDVTIKFDEKLESKIAKYIRSNYGCDEEILFKVKSFIPSQRYIEGIIDRETFDYMQSLRNFNCTEE